MLFTFDLRKYEMSRRLSQILCMLPHRQETMPQKVVAHMHMPRTLPVVPIFLK